MHFRVSRPDTVRACRNSHDHPATRYDQGANIAARGLACLHARNREGCAFSFKHVTSGVRKVVAAYAAVKTSTDGYQDGIPVRFCWLKCIQVRTGDSRLVMPEVTLACIGGRWGGRDDIIYDHVDLAAARILYVFNVARLHWWLGLHADLPQTFRHNTAGYDAKVLQSYYAGPGVCGAYKVRSIRHTE